MNLVSKSQIIPPNMKGLGNRVLMFQDFMFLEDIQDNQVIGSHIEVSNLE
jgi:hypothetical protein